MNNLVIFGAISNFRPNLRNPIFENFSNNFLAKYSHFLWEICVWKCPTLLRGSDAKVTLLAHVHISDFIGHDVYSLLLRPANI